MLPDAAQIRKTARTVYASDCVGSLLVSFAMMTTAFLGWLVSNVISSVFGAVGLTVFSLLYVLLIASPVILGGIRYFSVLIEGKPVKPTETFHYFSSFGIYARALRFIFCFLSVILVTTVVFMLIPSLLTVFSSSGVYKMLGISMPIWTPVLKTASVFLEILAVVLIIVVNVKYYLAAYFFASNDSISVLSALNLSVTVSRRTRSDFRFLVLSMTGYILLSLPVLPLFFILPYFMLAYVIHSKCAAFQYNEAIDCLYRR